jgi:hypothetical protein
MKAKSEQEIGIRVWHEFLTCLRQDGPPSEKVRPYVEELRPAVEGFLANLRNTEFNEAAPEIHRVGSQIHYLLTLDREPYCFSFLIEDGDWRFQHVECITLRLDRIGELPCSVFPDLPEDRKAWMRAELETSRQVALFNYLAQENGKDFAYHWFRDGAGYALAARSWVPFEPLHRAFILYLCWEEANLRGGRATLHCLNDREALVALEPLCFQLYERTGHLRIQISLGDYRKLYETVWEDRARQAGWEVEFAYIGNTCWMNFNGRNRI